MNATAPSEGTCTGPPRHNDMLLSIVIPLVPATVLVGLRFYARRIKKVNLWWDDWLALLALFNVLLEDASYIWALKLGLGRCLRDLNTTPEQAAYNYNFTAFIGEHGYTAAIGATQLSLLALYWRLFRYIDGARIVVIVLTVTVFIWILARVFIAIFQCWPINYMWNKSIDGHCFVNPGQFFVGSVAAQLVIDVALMALPASQIGRLNLPLGQKFAIGLMFMFGFVVCIASTIMIHVSQKYGKITGIEVMYYSTPPTIWSSVEIHLSLISCCLPVLRPILTLFNGWCTRNFSSQELSDNHQSSQGFEIGHMRKSFHRHPGESTMILAETLDTTVEPTHIYGQGEGANTVIMSNTTFGDVKKGDAASRVEDGIVIKYEVNMSFSDLPQYK